VNDEVAHPTDTKDILSWRITHRDHDVRPYSPYPREIWTGSPAFRSEHLPDEVALLLPNHDGNTSFLRALNGHHGVEGARVEGGRVEGGRVEGERVAADTEMSKRVAGLFLADPFLNMTPIAKDLERAGVGWICNLPSVDQQDEDFYAQLSDVGLDRGRELERLQAFRDRGFQIAVVVTHQGGSAAALALRPDAILCLPRVIDFAAGFPSLLQRGHICDSVAQQGKNSGWDGPILMLGKPDEADHPRIWPDSADGLFFRSDS